MSIANSQKVYEEVEDGYDLVRDRKSDIPFGDYQVGSADATEVDFNANDYIQTITTKTTPKWRFKTTGFKLYSSKPIEVAITRQDGIYYVENESLEIYASGNSEHEAIEDFCQHVIYFYKHYKQLGWDKVTGHAKRLKEIYETLFREVS